MYAIRSYYAGVGGDHPALGGGDVRAPLEQARREAGGQRRGGEVERRGVEGEGRGRLPRQHRQGVLQFAAPLLQADRFGLGDGELGLRPGEIELADLAVVSYNFV